MDGRATAIDQRESGGRRRIMAKANNPLDTYVRVAFTPREAKIVSMVLSNTPTTEIANYFKITVERVDQIIERSRRKIDFVRTKMATEATSKPCMVRNQEGEE